MEQKAKPFLKWAGGKGQLLETILAEFPPQIDDNSIYIEPFVGGGAVLFGVLNKYPNLKTVIVNDINLDLINSYKAIRDEVLGVIRILEKWQGNYYSFVCKDEKKDDYYSKRDLFNQRTSSPIMQTALFIFLNKTCFNGLYRVNKNNKFNVPIGDYKKPLICDTHNLLVVSKALQRVQFWDGDFQATLFFGGGGKRNLFYLDPPYKPLNETSKFNSYSSQQFNDDEQVRLKKFCDKLDDLGSQWILSNSDVKAINPEDTFFDDLYRKYQIKRVLARRSINSKGSQRGKITELLITNKK